MIIDDKDIFGEIIIRVMISYKILQSLYNYYFIFHFLYFFININFYFHNDYNTLKNNR